VLVAVCFYYSIQKREVVLNMSLISSDLSSLPAQDLKQVSKNIKIDFEEMEYSKFKETIGVNISKEIYNVKGFEFAKVYKILPFNNLSIRECRITKIAADIGVAPAFRRALIVTNWNGKQLI